MASGMTVNHLVQSMGSSSLSRPTKLKFIFDKSKVRYLEESLLPISSVQYDIGGSISLLLARVSTFNASVALIGVAFQTLNL